MLNNLQNVCLLSEGIISGETNKPKLYL